MAQKPYNIVIKQGMEKTLEMTLIADITGSTEIPRDLTGHTVKALIKKNHTDTGSLAQFTLANTLDASGSIHLVLTSAQTEALELGTYPYDVIVSLGSENIIQPVFGVASVVSVVSV